jgi:dipeptidyl aminopeptidase/acylaminoacyl peptidase
MKGTRIGTIDSVPERDGKPAPDAAAMASAVTPDLPRSLAAEPASRLRLAGDPQVAADGTIAYVQSWLDLDADATRRTIVLVPGVAGVAGPTSSAADASGSDRAGADGLAGPHTLLPERPGAGLLTPPLGGADAWCPRWSPDGDRLAMITADGGPARVAVWRRDAQAVTALGDLPGDATDLDWSPDGRALAVTCVRSEALTGGTSLVHPAGAGYVDGWAGLARTDRRVFALPAGGGPAKPLLTDAWQPRWSPDGTRLAFLSTDGWLCVVDPSRPDEVTKLAADAVAFTWSPSGGELAYLAPLPGIAADIECRLFTRRATGGRPPVELAANWDRSIGSTVRGDDARGAGTQAPVWSPATGRVYFCVADGGRGLIGWAGPDAADFGVQCDGPRSCIDLSLSGNGRAIAYVSTDLADPGTVCSTDLRTGAERRLTAQDTGWRGTVGLAPVRPVRARAADGTELEGWVTGPGAGRPLVVSIHGGPHYPVGFRFSAEAQRLAARGYAVLTANPRGSGGYGRGFATAIRGRWGTIDWSDLASVIDVAVAECGLDGERVAVTGVSYGGYLTLRAITLTRRFRAAISENGISNLLALWGSGAEDPGWLAGEMGGPPWERAPEYVAASPLAAADQIRTPLLLIHAELDQNCPVAQSEQLLAALRQRGETAELVRLPGEGHLINLNGLPSRRLARARAVDAWLDRYLRGRGQEDGNGS